MRGLSSGIVIELSDLPGEVRYTSTQILLNAIMALSRVQHGLPHALLICTHAYGFSLIKLH